VINRNSRKVLSHRDTLELLELIYRSTSCTDENSFRGLMEGLRSLIPFCFAICGSAQLGKGGTIVDYDVVNISYPTEWLSLYIAERYHEIDPVVKENFGNFALQYWEDTYSKWEPPKDFVMRASDFGLSHGYTHGVLSPDGHRGSLFSFAGEHMKRDCRTEAILWHIIPHLHNALSPVIRAQRSSKPVLISPREREVLNWLKLGKTNMEMSAILGISENTVKYHLKLIMQKLNTRTRTQTVAVALAQRLIELE
jgi:DNA-binding CsgD family transcriptional regulator